MDANHLKAMLKHAIGEFQGRYLSETPSEHLDHCIEYLRQVRGRRRIPQTVTDKIDKI